MQFQGAHPKKGETGWQCILRIVLGGHDVPPSCFLYPVALSSILSWVPQLLFFFFIVRLIGFIGNRERKRGKGESKEGGGGERRRRKGGRGEKEKRCLNFRANIYMLFYLCYMYPWGSWRLQPHCRCGPCLYSCSRRVFLGGGGTHLWLGN